MTRLTDVGGGETEVLVDVIVDHGGYLGIDKGK